MPPATSASRTMATRSPTGTSRSGCCRERALQAVGDDVPAVLRLGRLVYLDRRVHDEPRDGEADALALHGKPDRGHRGAVLPGARGRPLLRDRKSARCAPPTFILLLLVYNLCYMPTLGLANSLAFHHIQTQERQFPLIRVFGTIGWIVAGLAIDFVLGPMIGSGPVPEQTALPIYTTTTASVLLGLFAFSLPHTPPPGAGQRVSLRSIVRLDSLTHLGDRPFYVFIAASLLLCIPLAAYYN